MVFGITLKIPEIFLKQKISHSNGSEIYRVSAKVVALKGHTCLNNRMLLVKPIFTMRFRLAAGLSICIRLTVFSRRREIGIMKYVGATDWFIRWPFLIEGMLLGAGGAFLAVILLTQLYSTVTNQVYDTLAFLPLLPKYPYLHYVNLIIFLAGLAIGALGSVISVKKFLKA